jgi:hypothetical protein
MASSVRSVERDDLFLHVAASRQSRVKLLPFNEPEWVRGHGYEPQVVRRAWGVITVSVTRPVPARPACLSVARGPRRRVRQ